MPIRTKEHEIEAASRRRLRDIFESAGWIVWDLNPDYGEDLLVRIFTNQKATQYSFFVQAKATDNIGKYKYKKHIGFPIEIDHLDNWNKFWEPVILTIWDATNDITYWQIIQDQLQSNRLKVAKKPTQNIRVPYEKAIYHKKDKEDPEKISKELDKIFDLTKKRFKRFERLTSGTEALISVVNENTGAKIYYNFDEEIMIMEDAMEAIHIIYFYEAFEIIQHISSKLNISPEQVSRLSLIQGHVNNGDYSKVNIRLDKDEGASIFYDGNEFFHCRAIDEIKSYIHDKLIEMHKNYQ